MIQLKVQNYTHPQLVLLDYALEKAQDAILQVGCSQSCTTCKQYRICRDLAQARVYISIQIDKVQN